MLSRRAFLWFSTLAGSGLPFARVTAQRSRGASSDTGPVPPSIAALASMRSQATPISVDERRGRIDRARRLMTESSLDAIVLTGGTSLTYFTGIRWGGSERLFAVVVPAKGDAFCVCPAFEEERAREQLALGPLKSADVRTWQEDESPVGRVAPGL